MTGARWLHLVEAASRELGLERSLVILTILSVAYPLAPVGIDAGGGAEQVLTALDRALAAAGHRSLVVACEGSSAAGQLIEVSRRRRPPRRGGAGRAWARHRAAIAAALDRWPVDLVHMHGIDFDAYLPPPGVPVLATLHLPPSWYPPEALRPARPDTWLNCVSAAQHAACPATPNLLAPIENGVAVEALAARHAKRGFALVARPHLPGEGRASRDRGREGGRRAAPHRRRGVGLRGAPALFRRGGARRGSIAGAASSGRSALPASAAS